MIRSAKLFSVFILLMATGQPAVAAFGSRASAQMSVGAQVMDCALITGGASATDTAHRGCHGMQTAIAELQICARQKDKFCEALLPASSGQSSHGSSLAVQYF